MHKLAFLFFLSLQLLCLTTSCLQAKPDSVQKVILRNGIELHFISKGSGEPLIFIHGSLSDFSYWENQIELFSKYFHVISYSRRYNWPNVNAPIAGYSAITDAEELRDSLGWKNLSASGMSETMRSVWEWEVMLTKGALFQTLTRNVLKGSMCRSYYFQEQNLTGFLHSQTKN